MPLPSDPVLLEKTMRTAVSAKLTSVDAADPEALRWRVNDRPHWVENETQWLNVAGIKHPQSMQTGGLETRAVFLHFTGFDEVDEGKCDQTILTLHYDFDLMFSIVEKRKDGSNSYDDFVAYQMRTRASFKADRSFGYPRNLVEHKLLQTAQVAREEKVDYATVHRINFSLAIELDVG
jgi:hypothetical protein